MCEGKKDTKMTILVIVIIGVLVLQILIFVTTRSKIKKNRANSIVEKYNIKTSGDAWRLINDPRIPDKDRHKIEEIYQGNKKENS